MRNRIIGSKQIFLEAKYEDNENQICSYQETFLDNNTEKQSGTPFPEHMRVLYLTADRIGVQDAYVKSLNGEENIETDVFRAGELLAASDPGVSGAGGGNYLFLCAVSRPAQPADLCGT